MELQWNRIYSSRIGYKLKEIKFVPTQGMEHVLAPTPIKNHVPDWYKNAEMYDTDGNAALKTCVPFLDAMLSGYTLTTWEDLRITQKRNVITIEDGEIQEDGTFIPKANQHQHGHDHGSKGNVIKSRMVNERLSTSGSTIPRPQGHLTNHLVWSGVWGMKAPRGHSILVTHPFNRFDLPFTTVSGIIDSDGWVPPGNIPFFLQKGFNGVIPKGTPFAQIFPYKRDKWSMSINKILQARAFFDGKIDRSEVGYYKKKFWNRKSYN